MAVQFNENVIVEYADRLYRRAATMVVTHFFLGAIGGAVVGLGAAQAFRVQDPPTAAAIVSLLVAIVAAVAAHERGFGLRLQAQIALCQLQIERNTRAAISPQSYAMPPTPHSFAPHPPQPPPARGRW